MVSYHHHHHHWITLLITALVLLPSVIFVQSFSSIRITTHNNYLPKTTMSDPIQTTKTTTTTSSSTTSISPATTTKKPSIQITWEPLATAEIMKRFRTKTTHRDQPLMVRVVGIPGSGKSTSCQILASLIQQELDKDSSDSDDSSSDNGQVLVVPFDGYHYPLSTLQSLPQAPDLIYRRGAPDTFDAPALHQDLRRIRYGDKPKNDSSSGNSSSNGDNSTISLPGFDHALGDPTPHQHTFLRRRHSIVIVEGLYLLHDREPAWRELQDANLFDFGIFIDSDVDTCIARLKIRNRCIPGYTPEEIDVRCDAVDRTNAMTVLESRGRADLCVPSSAI